MKKCEPTVNPLHLQQYQRHQVDINRYPQS